MDSARVVRVGINGVGKLGRCLARILSKHERCRVVAINDGKKSIIEAARSLKDCRLLSRYEGDVACSPDGKAIMLGDVEVLYFHEEKPHHIPWGHCDVDVVIDATSKFLTREALHGHIMAGAKRVVLAALPMADSTIPTIAIGVNEGSYKGQDMVSAGTPKMQCFAPILKIFDEAFGIDEAAVTVVHQISSQSLVTGERAKAHPAEPPRCFRTYGNHIFPLRSSSWACIDQVLPALDGKVAGVTFFVPGAEASVADVVAHIRKPATPKKILATMEAAAASPQYKGLFKVTTDAVVSADFHGDAASCTFDGKMIRDSPKFTMLSPHFVKILAWADLSWSYGMRIVDIVELAAKDTGRVPRARL
jgi:glyceraldehyde 3-phosphate dehydrogenase